MRAMTDPERLLFVKLNRACEILTSVTAADVPAGVTTTQGSSVVVYARMRFQWTGEHPGPWQMRVSLHAPPRDVLILLGKHDPKVTPQFQIAPDHGLDSLPIAASIVTRTADELQTLAQTAKENRRLRLESEAAGEATALATFLASYV